VQQAKKRKKPKVQVISPDWIDMSMFHNKIEKLDEYSHLQKHEDANAKKRQAKKEAKALKEGETGVNSSEYCSVSGYDFARCQSY
jgi:hypothetical protein